MQLVCYHHIFFKLHVCDILIYVNMCVRLATWPSMQHLSVIHATSVCHPCNICLSSMQHLSVIHTISFCHPCNICLSPIHMSAIHGNICLSSIQHMSAIHATSVCHPWQHLSVIHGNICLPSMATVVNI